MRDLIVDSETGELEAIIDPLLDENYVYYPDVNNIDLDELGNQIVDCVYDRLVEKKLDKKTVKIGSIVKKYILKKSDIHCVIDGDIDTVYCSTIKLWIGDYYSGIDEHESIDKVWLGHIMKDIKKMFEDGDDSELCHLNEIVYSPFYGSGIETDINVQQFKELYDEGYLYVPHGLFLVPLSEATEEMKKDSARHFMTEAEIKLVDFFDGKKVNMKEEA